MNAAESMLGARTRNDRIARGVMCFSSGAAVSLLLLLAGTMALRAKPVLAAIPLGQLVFSGQWHPANGQFGLAYFIAGTVWVTAVALVIAVPLCLLTAIYLAEYAPPKVREYTRPALDLLAGISPVIYGVWGILVVVPAVRDYLMPLCAGVFPFFPFVSDNDTGFCVLSAGIVLALMIAPLIISISEEVIEAVPQGMRHASLSLGATRWQTVKHAVLRKARGGIIASVILGLSRAFGETMAVLMVVGCSLQSLPHSVFDPGYPLPALIANTYGEMMSLPLYDAALFTAAFILLAVTVLFTVLGRGLLLHLDAGEGGHG